MALAYNKLTSALFSLTMGASYDQLPLLWLAGPVTGLLIQPLIGAISDRTWTSFGRRKPFFLWGRNHWQCCSIIYAIRT